VKSMAYGMQAPCGLCDRNPGFDAYGSNSITPLRMPKEKMVCHSVPHMAVTSRERFHM
jgi:hypothetical protein